MVTLYFHLLCALFCHITLYCVQLCVNRDALLHGPQMGKISGGGGARYYKAKAKAPSKAQAKRTAAAARKAEANRRRLDEAAIEGASASFDAGQHTEKYASRATRSAVRAGTVELGVHYLPGHEPNDPLTNVLKKHHVEAAAKKRSENLERLRQEQAERFKDGPLPAESEAILAALQESTGATGAADWTSDEEVEDDWTRRDREQNEATAQDEEKEKEEEEKKLGRDAALTTNAARCAAAADRRAGKAPKKQKRTHSPSPPPLRRQQEPGQELGQAPGIWQRQLSPVSAMAAGRGYHPPTDPRLGADAGYFKGKLVELHMSRLSDPDRFCTVLLPVAAGDWNERLVQAAAQGAANQTDEDWPLEPNEYAVSVHNRHLDAHPTPGQGESNLALFAPIDMLDMKFEIYYRVVDKTSGVPDPANVNVVVPSARSPCEHPPSPPRARAAARCIC